MSNVEQAGFPTRGNRRWVLRIWVVICLLSMCLFFWRPWEESEPKPSQPEIIEPIHPGLLDPRLTYATPYRNVRPEVKYVGDAVCAECHDGHAKTFRQHPMGRSLAPVAVSSSPERYAAASNPFNANGFVYRVERDGERVVHSETAVDPKGQIVAKTSADVHFVVGSGRSAQAYLMNRDGCLFASPITWYSKGLWALSPGYEKQNPHFARPITADCLFCHSNFADHVAGTANRFRAPVFHGHAIGCERCHGPGELHVQLYHDGNDAVSLDDNTIVNPARLEPFLHESICQQCHLQGQQRIPRRGISTFDYRPGVPFHLFYSEFVKPAKYATTKFVGAVEQMHASRCYQESAGRAKRMTCTSCHDPHSVPPRETKVAFYRERCMNCHEEKPCKVPVADRIMQNKQDSCIACHMKPTGSDVPHTMITDHRVLRRPDASVNTSTDDWLRSGEVPLVHFHRKLVEQPDPEIDRDLGIALMRLADSQPSAAVVRSLAERALPLLETALNRQPDDWDACEAKGNALWFLGQLIDANLEYERVLLKEPERETTLYLAARLNLSLRRPDHARELARRAIQVNPWRWEFHQTLAKADMQRQAWSDAISACQEVLKLNAVELETRHLLVMCYLRQGERTRAKEEFDALMALKPPDREKLRHWFEQVSK